MSYFVPSLERWRSPGKEIKMKIKKILSQSRRDFVAIYECEHCGYAVVRGRYDDTHFHAKVIPEMVCEKCGKTADESYRPLTTKYPDGTVV